MSLKAKNTNRKVSNFHQVVLLDEKGSVLESCNSIFNTSEFKGTNICDHFCFLESEFETIKNNKSNKIAFEKIQTEHPSLPGYYDFVFSRSIIENETCLVWDIFDYTNVYEEYIKVQQLKNELDIQKQFLSLKESPLHKYSSKGFFQTEYLANTNAEQSGKIDDLITSKYDILDLQKSSGKTSNKFLDLEHLRDNLEILTEEISKFIGCVKEGEAEEFEIRKTIDNELNNGFKESSHKKVVYYSEDLPKSLKMSKDVLTQIFALLCRDESTQQLYINTSLDVGYNKKDADKHFLTVNYTEQIDSPQPFSQNLSMRVIKISVLRSLVDMIGGSLVPNSDVKKGAFNIFLSFPVK